MVFLKPRAHYFVPEYILIMTVSLFFAYILSLSVYDFLRNIRSIKFKSILSKDVLERYGDFFFAMFVISSILSFFNLPFIGTIFFMIVFFIALEIIRLNMHGETQWFFNYRIWSAVLFLYFVFFNQFPVLLIVIQQSIFLCGLLFIFSFVRYFNVYACPLDELKAGMVPAETIIKKGSTFTKENVPYISPFVYLRKKVINKIFKRHELITPFRHLTNDSIKILRTKTHFDILMVQRTIDMRIFLIIGIIATYFVR